MDRKSVLIMNIISCTCRYNMYDYTDFNRVGT